MGCGASDQPNGGDAALSVTDASRKADGVSDTGINADSPETAGSVSGTVVDRTTSRPLAGRKVVIGSNIVSTNAEGHFTVANAPAVYDAIVVDPDGATVSVYLGLTRRDPLLAHQPSDVSDASGNEVKIEGSVGGDATFPPGAGNGVDVYAFSSTADSYAPLSGTDPSVASGPSYGPLLLGWYGTGALTGQVVGLGLFSSADGGSWWAYGEKPFTADNGQTAQVNVGILAVSTVTIGGTVEVPSGYYLAAQGTSYRFPIVHADVAVTSDQSGQTRFSDTLPDLRASASPCIQATGLSLPGGTLVTQLCGLTPTESATVVLEAAPAFSAPFDGTSLSTAGSLSWTSFDGGIYSLSLQASPPSRETPDIEIFTSATTVSWPKLEAVGIPFPIGSTYQFTIIGLGPFSSIDDSFGPDGVGAAFPTERRWSYSPSANVLLSP